MAIFRGGKRIGPFDLRIGLPRGREYDKFEVPPAGRPETTINRFRAAIAKGEGLARTNKFLVRVNAPQKLELNKVFNNEQITNTELARLGTKQARAMNSSNQEIGREIGLLCESITMPGRTFRTNPYRHYGPSYNYPVAVEYTPIQATFIGDKHLRLRQFFENWQSLIYDNMSNNMGFYDDYTSTIDLFQLGGLDELNDRDAPTYACRLFEVYPSVIDPINYAYSENNQYVKIAVTFSYRKWLNYNIDIDATGKVGGLSSGEIKPGFQGPDWFAKLPPELKRTGRDAFNALKRSIPIGAVFGGKVFPPFTF